MKSKYFVLTDNSILYQMFYKLLKKKGVLNKFDFYCSPGNIELQEFGLNELNIKESQEKIINNYSKGFSIHSKQMFPKKLVESIKCINVHPGYNPYNRGWYPQVFSIINDEIIGATIHFMDDKLDNGDIIDRMKVNKELWDTSESLYNKILESELKLLEKNLDVILANDAVGFAPEFKGRLYLKKDFDNICEIDLNRKGTFLEFYNLLRALTFEKYDNAYIKDVNSERKIYLKLNISHE